MHARGWRFALPPWRRPAHAAGGLPHLHHSVPQLLGTVGGLAQPRHQRRQLLLRPPQDHLACGTWMEPCAMDGAEVGKGSGAVARAATAGVLASAVQCSATLGRQGGAHHPARTAAQLQVLALQLLRIFQCLLHRQLIVAVPPPVCDARAARRHRGAKGRHLVGHSCRQSRAWPGACCGRGRRRRGRHRRHPARLLPLLGRRRGRRRATAKPLPRRRWCAAARLGVGPPLAAATTWLRPATAAAALLLLGPAAAAAATTATIATAAAACCRRHRPAPAAASCSRRPPGHGLC